MRGENYCATMRNMIQMKVLNVLLKIWKEKREKESKKRKHDTETFNRIIE